MVKKSALASIRLIRAINQRRLQRRLWIRLSCCLRVRRRSYLLRRPSRRTLSVSQHLLLSEIVSSARSRCAAAKNDYIGNEDGSRRAGILAGRESLMRSPAIFIFRQTTTAARINSPGHQVTVVWFMTAS